MQWSSNCARLESERDLAMTLHTIAAARMPLDMSLEPTDDFTDRVVVLGDAVIDHLNAGMELMGLDPNQSLLLLEAARTADRKYAYALGAMTAVLTVFVQDPQELRSLVDQGVAPEMTANMLGEFGKRVNLVLNSGGIANDFIVEVIHSHDIAQL